MSLPSEAISLSFLVNVASLNAGNALKPKHVMIGFCNCVECTQYLCHHIYFTSHIQVYHAFSAWCDCSGACVCVREKERLLLL